MSSSIQNIPDSLVYEMVNGKPIYYRGYKDFLRGTKQLEQVVGSSKFQAFLAAELIYLIKSFLGKEYLIFSNELGIQFSKKSWRAGDIAIVKKNKVKKLDSKYLSIPPEYVIEIDTKADLGEINNPLGYYQEKTQELLNFGVKKIIWIFTDTEKIMVADQGSKRWEILDWDQDVELVKNLNINVHGILEDHGLK